MKGRRWARADTVTALALTVGTFVYCALLPLVLGDQDEAKELYQALRLLSGARWFVDVFDLIPPGLHYILAGAFAVGGRSLATARAVDALIHAAAGLGVFAIGRTLGVSRGLATLAAVADLCWARPAWPVTSPHWLSTALGLWMVWALLRLGRHGAAVAGVLVGLLGTVQQQRAAPLAVGAAATLAVQWALMKPRPSPVVLGRRAAAFVAGALAVLVPAMFLLVVGSGAEAVYHALILHPLRYGAANPDRVWGAVGPFPWFARHSFPRLLAYGLPAVGLASGVLAAADGARRLASSSSSAVLAVFSLAWMGSVVYHPDYIHLAFVTPFFAVVAAHLLARVGEWAVPVWMRRGLLLLAGLGCAAQLGRVAVDSWRAYPVTHATAFGSMAFRDAVLPRRIDALRSALAAADSDELFVYPFGAAFYLWSGATNPTALQFLVPGYTTPVQFRAVLDTLERRRTPFVILTMYGPDDPVVAYVHEHYAPVPDQPDPAILFRRRPPGG